jgi:hypothetical protein
MAGALMGVALLAAGDVLAQATPKPPERMTYQGFLTGADGVPLGNTAPKAYDVVFRIHDSEQGGEVLWGEQQTVTMDKGYFSVLLGEGGPVSGVPNAGVTLSSLFVGASASDRYVGVTVKGVGSGNTDVEILPRVRLLSAPYAYLAASAVKLVQTTGADLLTSSGNTVTVSGSLVANALAAGSVIVTNGVNAASVVASNSVATASVTAGSLVVTNGVTAGPISAGAITATSLTAGSINAANSLTVPSITASGNIAAGGQLTAGNMVITNGATLLGRGLLTRGTGQTAPLRVVIGRYWWNGTSIAEEHDQPEHSIQRISTGHYRITLTTRFDGTPYPVAIVTGFGGGNYTYNVTSPRDNIDRLDRGPTWPAFDVWVYYRDSNAFQIPYDAGFNFMVIGAN